MTVSHLQVTSSPNLAVSDVTGKQVSKLGDEGVNSRMLQV